VPFVARWRPIGKLPSARRTLTDLFATFAAVTGRTLGRGGNYNEILPSSETSPIRDAIISHSAGHTTSRRLVKLVLSCGSGSFTKPDRIEPRPSARGRLPCRRSGSQSLKRPEKSNSALVWRNT
jgi:hypothetical protein